MTAVYYTLKTTTREKIMVTLITIAFIVVFLVIWTLISEGLRTLLVKLGNNVNSTTDVAIFFIIWPIIIIVIIFCVAVLFPIQFLFRKLFKVPAPTE